MLYFYYVISSLLRSQKFTGKLLAKKQKAAEATF